MPIESVDAYLGESAVLAVVLYAHARLIAKTVGKAGSTNHVEHLVAEHANQSAAVAPFHFALVAGDNNLFEHHNVFRQLEIHVHSALYVDRLALRNKTNAANLDSVASGFNVFETEMPRFIGICAVCGSGEYNCEIRNVRAIRLINRVPGDSGCIQAAVAHCCAQQCCKNA